MDINNSNDTLVNITTYFLSDPSFIIHMGNIILTTTSLFFVFISFLLSIVLFPPLELPPIHGLHNIGVIDLHMPITDNTTNSSSTTTTTTDNDGNGKSTMKNHPPSSFPTTVKVRMFYPTSKKQKQKQTIPYLSSNIANAVCKAIMSNAPSTLLQKMYWILFYFKFIQLHAIPNAPPLLSSSSSSMPIVIYSHGSSGMSILYSYQAMYLASHHGMMVLMIDHADGSALVVERMDGSLMLNDSSIYKMFQDGKQLEATRMRRQQTNFRVNEFMAAYHTLLHLNNTQSKNNNILQNLPGISFVSKLNTKDVTFMGHSFGAATALVAASRYSNECSRVIAHDPATDWMPNDARRDLYSKERLEGGKAQYVGGTGGYYDGEEEEEDDKKTISKEQQNKEGSVHDVDLFFLYSDEYWKSAKVTGTSGTAAIRSMYTLGRLGHPNKLKDIGYVKECRHFEFGDITSLLPLWLTRALKFAGNHRNPIETGEEIAQRTLAFIQQSQKQKQKQTQEQNNNKQE